MSFMFIVTSIRDGVALKKKKFFLDVAKFNIILVVGFVQDTCTQKHSVVLLKSSTKIAAFFFDLML